MIGDIISPEIFRYSSPKMLLSARRVKVLGSLLPPDLQRKFLSMSDPLEAIFKVFVSWSISFL